MQKIKKKNKENFVSKTKSRINCCNLYIVYIYEYLLEINLIVKDLVV